MIEPQLQPQNQPQPQEESHHDDCEDCRRERKENEKYIEVYQRMQALRKHVKRTACEVKAHSAEMAAVRTLSKSLDTNLIKAAKANGQAYSRTIQTVGYQLAASSAEQHAKNKLKEENEFLRRRIQAIRRNDNLPGEHIFCLPKINEGRVIRKEEKTIKPSLLQYQLNTNGWRSSENDSQCGSTKLSFFKNTKKNSLVNSQKYRNLNLWLYEHQKQETLAPPISLRNRTGRHF